MKYFPDKELFSKSLPQGKYTQADIDAVLRNLQKEIDTINIFYIQHKAMVMEEWVSDMM
jgi:hypothetical protein